jgi:L-ascorbate metabolism protein UlaG (beta-lactamase superfamily)
MNKTRLIHLVSALILVALLTGCGPTTMPSAPTSAPSLTKPPASPTAPTASAPTSQDATINLTWYGQSTFVLSASIGLQALLDPMGPGTGYKIPTLDGIDLVTTSHEHSDHNAANLASGSPLVLRGLAGNDWAKIDQTVKGVRVRTVGVYHDDTQGSKRGKNSIFIFDMDGLRVAHLGDLGHALSPEQIKDVGPVDVILIPVGGYYTIDAKTAVEVVSQLNPKVVIPMHYRTLDLSASLASVLAPVDDFVKAIGNTAAVSEVGQTVTIERKLPASRTILVLKYKG